MTEIDDLLNIKEEETHPGSREVYNLLNLYGKELGDNRAEAIIQLFACFVLVVGVIASIIAGIMIRPVGALIFLFGSILSVLVWASLQVVANISNNIREIKHELRKK